MQNPPPNNYPPNGPFYPPQRPNYPPNQSSPSYPPQQPRNPSTPPPGWQQRPQQGNYGGPSPWQRPPQQQPFTPPPTQGQQPNWQQPGPPPPKPGRGRRFADWYRRQSRPKQIIVALALIAAVIFVLSAVISGAVQGTQQALTPTPTAATGSQPTHTSQSADTPTAQPQAAYPPKSRADLQGLGAQGDASQIHEFHSESVGLTGVCPQPKREVTVSPGITGKQLAKDLLAYYYASQIENPCGGVVFAFHSQADAAAGNGYTAGRILLDVTDSSGQNNSDPNATGLTYTLTLDIGSAESSQESIITWQS